MHNTRVVTDLQKYKTLSNLFIVYVGVLEWTGSGGKKKTKKNANMQNTVSDVGLTLQNRRMCRPGLVPLVFSCPRALQPVTRPGVQRRSCVETRSTCCRPVAGWTRSYAAAHRLKNNLDRASRNFAVAQLVSTLFNISVSSSAAKPAVRCILPQRTSQQGSYSGLIPEWSCLSATYAA